MRVRDGTELLSVVFQLIIYRVTFLFCSLVALAIAEENIANAKYFVTDAFCSQHIPYSRYSHCFLCILPLSSVV